MQTPNKRRLVFMMVRRSRDHRDRPKPPPPDIYEVAGTLHGEGCLQAYAPNGDFTLRTFTIGDLESEAEARGQLESWLAGHGVTLPRRATSLFLA